MKQCRRCAGRNRNTKICLVLSSWRVYLDPFLSPKVVHSSDEAYFDTWCYWSISVGAVKEPVPSPDHQLTWRRHDSLSNVSAAVKSDERPQTNLQLLLADLKLLKQEAEMLLQSIRTSNSSHAWTQSTCKAAHRSLDQCQHVTVKTRRKSLTPSITGGHFYLKGCWYKWT